MTKNELLLLSSCITVLSSQLDATPKINTLLSSLFDHHSQKADFITHKNFKWKPNKKEILSMPDKFKKIFTANGIVIPYRIKKNGVYEARVRRADIHIEVSSKNLDTLKNKFIAALNDFSQPIPANCPVSAKFDCFTRDWLTLKEKLVKPSTFKEYFRLCNHDLIPAFGEFYISEISRPMLQDYLYSFVNSEKYRTAKKLYDLLRCIFELATEDFGFSSPMAKVVLPKYQQKKGKAFTKHEEFILVRFCKENPDKAASSALLVLLYFGLRQSELLSLRVIDEHWIECKTSKERLGQNEVIRKIPITPMAKSLLPYIDFKKASKTNPHTIATTLVRLFPNHHPHELRYTYITRCKECGVNPEVVMLWDGHEADKDMKASKVDRGYTDFSEEYLFKEALKVEYALE